MEFTVTRKGRLLMPYSELVKDYNSVRSYMRQFIAYGFRQRSELAAKSMRSYDNVRRRVESWLGDFMFFRSSAAGKTVFMSVDSRRIATNPLYRSWKAASFTKNDIALFFILLDILADGQKRTVAELVADIDEDYLALSNFDELVDSSTIRKKLKEYASAGLVHEEKLGKQLVYYRTPDSLSLESWRDALVFFTEENLLGVVGSFLLDKLVAPINETFTFKHRYLLYALDSDVLLDLLLAIGTHRAVELEVIGSQKDTTKKVITIPLKIYSSTQGGRQYLAASHPQRKISIFYRIDNIVKVKALAPLVDFNEYRDWFAGEQAHIWGVSAGRHRLEHLEMILAVDPKDDFVVQRLKREKRCGTVKELGDNRWSFTADVYDAREMLPWVRTFIGRIVHLSCSNSGVVAQFWTDFNATKAIYEDDDYAF